MDKEITKPFEWVEHEGKRYANQKQFAELLGIRADTLKRWLKQRKISIHNLCTLPKLNQTLYPYETVCTVVLTHEAKSELGMMLKKTLLNQLTQPRELPKTATVLLAPPKTARASLRETVAQIYKRTLIPYPDIWQKLWTELYYRCGINVRVQAHNRKVKAIDIIESKGYTDVSISILKEIFPEESDENI